MIGAIAGDVIGSVYEHHPIKTTEFPLFRERSRFTDDTVMTVAVAQAILDQSDYAHSMRLFEGKYPLAGYGGAFFEWIHDHPEGIIGAPATALAVFMANHGVNKFTIRNEINLRFGYNIQRKVDEIRPTYQFDVSCQGAVPEAIPAFLQSTDYENAIRLAISLGGDSDTLACIAGGIAQAFYKGTPVEIATYVRNIMPEDLLQIVDRFHQKFGL